MLFGVINTIDVICLRVPFLHFILMTFNVQQSLLGVIFYILHS